jgi:hypothetical protein
MRRLAGRLRLVFALAALPASLVMTDGCVIAEPPGDLPRPPQRRPVIITSQLVPQNSGVLATFPSRFVVPVELVDPTANFDWSAFVDFNPLTGDGLVAVSQSQFSPSNFDGKYRILEVEIPAPLDLMDRCHVIEIVVALNLLARETSDGRVAHTPREPGGDNAVWFYSPTGDLRGCPILDAGADAALDAADAADGPQ